MKIQQRNYFYLALLIPVVFLPGCGMIDWVKEKFGGAKKTEQPVAQATAMNCCGTGDTSEVLVTIKGQPAITVKSFEQEFELLLEENPQLKSVLPFMPDARKNLLVGLANQEIVDRYVRENNINQQEDYKRDLARFQRSMERMLNTKYFAAKHPVKMDESEIRAYYDNNKDKMQELLISQGGVQACGLRFDKEADAKGFLAKVQGKKLMDVAKAENKAAKVQDFKLVNKQSVGIDPMLRNKIVAIEKTPKTELVKLSDKTCWVIQATAKEEPKYRQFEEVKEPLRQVVEREKSNEALQKAIEDLKQGMQVVINDNYFKQAEVPEEQHEAAVVAEQNMPASKDDKKEEATARAA